MSPDLVIAAISDSYLAATLTRREDILGRGLLCRAIAERVAGALRELEPGRQVEFRSGGEVRAEGAVGAGATITFTIPDPAS